MIDVAMGGPSQDRNTMDFNETVCYAIVRSRIEKCHVRGHRILFVDVGRAKGYGMRAGHWRLYIYYLTLALSKLVLPAYQDYLGIHKVLYFFDCYSSV